MHPKIEAETRGYGDTFFIDEVFVKINGKQHEYRKDKRPYSFWAGWSYTSEP
ncbi:MAG: hypothetical protein ACI9GB_002722 [Halioglobus sp.]|jgi:hypothetical protein